MSSRRGKKLTSREQLAAGLMATLAPCASFVGWIAWADLGWPAPRGTWTLVAGAWAALAFWSGCIGLLGSLILVGAICRGALRSTVLVLFCISWGLLVAAASVMAILIALTATQGMPD